MKKNPTINHYLTRFLIIVSIAVLALATSIDYFKLSYELNKYLQNYSDTILLKLSKSTAPSIWKVDLDTLFETLESEMYNPYIKAILFKNDRIPDTSPVGVVREKDELVDYNHTLDLSEYLKSETSIYYDPEGNTPRYYGELQLYLDRDQLHQVLLRDLIIHLGELFLVILLLIVSVYLILNRMLSEPTARVTRNISDIGESIEEGDIDFSRSIEIIETLKRESIINSQEMELISNAIQKLLLSFKQHRDQLEQAKIEAEAATKAKEEFLAVVSHEMRTPLNPIMGFIDHMINMDQESKYREVLDMMHRAGFQLLGHIDNILTYSKLNNKNVKSSVEPIPLADFATTIFGKFEPLANEKRLNLSLELTIDGTPNNCGVIYSDKEMLETLVGNLVSNSFKFTYKGYVQVVFNLLTEKSDAFTKDLPGESQFHIEVKDSGLGISKEQLPHIFNHFTQADQSYKRKQQGLGLGLAICSKVTELLQGSIDVESEVDNGTTFSVKIGLPNYEILDNNIEKIHSNSAVTDYRFTKTVLVVDDDKLNRIVLSKLLKQFNLKIHTCSNGKEAVEMCESMPFDLIFMDISMPEMNGMEATRYIRKSEVSHTRAVPIVAFTAHTASETRNQCINSGMNGYMVKPANRFELQQVLSIWIRPD